MTDPPALVLILLLTLVVRIFPRLLWRKAVYSDTYLHLALARAIRDNGHRPAARIPRSILKHRLAYPYLCHWFMSFLPDRALLRVEPFLSALVDAAHVSLTYFFGRKILVAAGFGESSGPLAVMTSLLVAVAPAFLRAQAGPRAYNASPRPVGQLLFAAYACALALHSLGGGPAWIVLAVAAVAPLSLTSKFANQAVLFLSAGLCLFGDFIPLGACAAGWAVAGVLTGGSAYRVLYGQTKYSIFYFRYLQRRYLWPAHRSPLGYLRTLAGSILKRGARFPLWVFEERYFAHLLVFAFPQFLVLTWMLLQMRGPLLADPAAASLLRALGPWAAASLGWMLLTSCKPFLFLGEAARYAEFTIMPQMLLLTACARALDLPWAARGILIFSGIAYLFHLKIYSELAREPSAAYEKLLPMLEKIDAEDARVYAVGTYFWHILYGTRKARVLTPVSNDEDVLPREEWDAPFGNYPYPAMKIEELVRKFGLTHVIASEASIARYETLLEDRAFSEGRLKLLSRDGDYAVYGTKP